jgi:hypothetical protein
MRTWMTQALILQGVPCLPPSHLKALLVLRTGQATGNPAQEDTGHTGKKHRVC